MASANSGLNVNLHHDPVNFRYGMNSLSILMGQAMGPNPRNSSLYVSTNRRCDRIKIVRQRRPALKADIQRFRGCRQVRRDVPRKQFVDSVDRVIGNAFKYVGEIRFVGDRASHLEVR